MGRPQVFDSKDMVVALGQTSTVQAAAQLLDASAPLLFVRARQDPQVAKAIEEQASRREETLARLIVEHKGILSRIADVMGYGDPQAVRYHIVRSPRLRSLFQEVRERVVDRAEENVFAAVEMGNLAYSWKVLQTLGKNRGYVERREVDAQVVHTVEHQGTDKLVAMLDASVEAAPQLLEDTFQSLPEGDRRLLAQALKRHSPADAEMVEAAT